MRYIKAKSLFFTVAAVLATESPAFASAPATSFSCAGYPKVVIKAGKTTVYAACRIVAFTAPTTTNLALYGSTNGLVATLNQAAIAHGDPSTTAITGYAQIWGHGLTVADATTLANNVTIRVQGGVVRASTPRTQGIYQSTSVGFEVFTPASTLLTLNSEIGDFAASGYTAGLAIAGQGGNISMNNVGGKVTATTLSGNINIVESGNAYVGTGMTAISSVGNINFVAPSGYVAAIKARSANGTVSFNGVTTYLDFLTAHADSGTGAPILLATQTGNVIVKH